MLPWEGAILRGKRRPIVKYRDTLRSSAKTAKRIEMPFGLWARINRRNRVRWGPRSPIGRGKFKGKLGAAFVK